MAAQVRSLTTPAEVLAQLDSQGYALLPGFFTAAQLEALRRVSSAVAKWPARSPQ